MTWTRPIMALSAALSLVACGESHSTDDAGPRMDASEGFDAGPRASDGGTNDAGPDAAPTDAGARRDGGERVLCDAMDARRETCPEVLCDGPDRWYWNGDRCFALDCGSCTGADCDLGVLTEAECTASHASCRPSICRATGGTWMWWAEECGDRICGDAVPETCLIGFAVCDCGPTASFGASGCAPDARCTAPPMRTREQRCLDTGGAWEPICCDTVCGEHCGDACTTPSCNCGSGKVFDDDRGCVFATRCFERTSGQSCAPGQTRCADGTICCDRCGGAGCQGMPRCTAPVCDDDPNIDECGNNLLAP